MKPFKLHKYKARPTGGYASKRESEYAQHLQQEKRVGNILGWMEQVPVRMCGKSVKYTVDFMVIRNDWTVHFVEVKGVETPEWKLKMRILAYEFPDIYARLEVVR